jgi:hypothetical protein
MSNRRIRPSADANGNRPANVGPATQTPADLIREAYTCKQAAEILGLRAETIRSWCCRGELSPVYNVGSDQAPRYRIPRETLLKKCEVVKPLILN